MTIWEYNVVEKWGVPYTSQEMNQYGETGWELVTIIEAYITLKGISEKASRYYIFKRPKEKS
jgi:hypothetical protein